MQSARKYRKQLPISRFHNAPVFPSLFHRPDYLFSVTAALPTEQTAVTLPRQDAKSLRKQTSFEINPPPNERSMYYLRSRNPQSGLIYCFYEIPVQICIFVSPPTESGRERRQTAAVYGLFN